ncbi:hypothetical protein [Streptomyces zaomyceticus]|uniref:hypothetical protein n=1 Tax=Streptomyces zaomyceticus TaxID=68286 RepID=UPI003438F3CB
MEDVIDALELRRVEPDVTLPRRVGQSQDHKDDIRTVVRHDLVLFAQKPEPGERALQKTPVPSPEPGQSGQWS